MQENTAPARERTGPIACRTCDLNEICRLTGLIAYSSGGRNRQSAGALRTLRPGFALYRAGAPAHSLYAIRQGMVKLTRVTPDGEERIVAFRAPGEALGLEAFALGVYACDAIALEPVVCCELPAPSLHEDNPHFAELSVALIRLLSQAASPPADLARGSARERVTNFLLDLSRRLEQRGLDAHQLVLSMSRQEIANLLDTRIETVSRTLQQLHREKAIHVRGSRIRLLAISSTEKAGATASSGVARDVAPDVAHAC